MNFTIMNYISIKKEKNKGDLKKVNVPTISWRIGSACYISINYDYYDNLKILLSAFSS